MREVPIQGPSGDDDDAGAGRQHPGPGGHPRLGCPRVEELADWEYDEEEEVAGLAAAYYEGSQPDSIQEPEDGEPSHGG